MEAKFKLSVNRALLDSSARERRQLEGELHDGLHRPQRAAHT
jgi:hypothetical protein